MTLRPCIECGEPCETGRCQDHQRVREHDIPTTARGYDTTWRKLSERARRLQPFCEDCGATTDLTTDHSPEAWKRKLAGKPIRLKDVAVLCRSCNSKRGRARPGGGNPRRGGHDRPREAKFQSHTSLIPVKESR